MTLMSVDTPVNHIPLVDRLRLPTVSTSEAVTPPCKDLSHHNAGQRAHEE